MTPDDSLNFAARFDNSVRYFSDRSPLVFASGRGNFITDTSGKVYLDANHGWTASNFGHCHPVLVETLTSQAQRLDITANMLTDRRLALSHRLAAFAGFPGGSAYFDCTGSHAIELARKLASAFTGKPKVVCFDDGFHGRTIGTLALTDPSFLSGYGIAIHDHAYRIPYPDGQSRANDTADDVIARLDRLFANSPDFGAILVEPALGPGGYRFPPKGFLKGLRQWTESKGILLIVDEVQMGLGRCGVPFLFQNERISPDLVVLGKSLGGGLYPMSAVVGRRDVMEALPPGTHTGSFAGSPIGCALGLTVLDILEEPGMLSEVRRLGERLRTGISSFGGDFRSLTLSIEGEGLATGIEFTSLSDKTSAAAIKEKIRMRLLDDGVFILGKGAQGNRLCAIPSLFSTDDELDMLVSRLHAACRHVDE